MSSYRLERLAELIREIASEIFRDMKDPRIGFVTITNVKVSADLRHAKIYVSIMGSGEEQAQTMKVLNNARGFIRKEIGSRIRLRYIPEFMIIHDESLEESAKVLEIINRVTKGDGRTETEQES